MFVELGPRIDDLAFPDRGGDVGHVFEGQRQERRGSCVVWCDRGEADHEGGGEGSGADDAPVHGDLREGFAGCIAQRRG